MAFRGKDPLTLTALRTSWSLRTLQEQTIIEKAGPVGDADIRDIEREQATQKEKLEFEAIPN
ncbi:hypothetical protein [Bradyrhizobium sp. Ai1a-2]|uniref:hypothetical protein n=1 Tax=Bradyrhizobium sp. Ai1a-2 TaxID=196490 RepID=UPI00040FD0A7|nr:hypothetical protein [Bradyrhizobium sp. Ai1a-2]